MVEALIAMSVLLVGFLGITTLLSKSLSLYRVTTDNYTATYLAAEGIEIVKNLIDAGTINGAVWGTTIAPGAYEVDYETDLSPSNSPQSYGGRFLAFDPVTQRYAYGAGDATSFRRRIIIENVTADQIRVNAIVDWTTRGGATFSTNVEDLFFNWR